MPLTVDDLVALVANTPSESQFGSAEEIAAAARLQGIDDPAAFLATLGIDVPAAAPAAPAAGAGLTTTGDPLNVVQGTDFLAQSLEVYLGLLGIGESAAVARSGQGIQRELGLAGIAESAADRGERGRQFDITSSFQKASQLAQLQANPLSAAESAFMRAGLGLDPFSGAGGGLAGADIAAMIGGQFSGPTFNGGGGIAPRFGGGMTSADMVQLPDGSFVPRSSLRPTVGAGGVPVGGAVSGRFTPPSAELLAERDRLLASGATAAGAGGGILDLGLLAAPTTRGAGGTSSVDIGGNVISSPATLSGRQLTQTAGSPAAGVIESLAAAAGNPGQRARSIAALIPTGFPG